jgi:hypothetical protein
MASRPETTDRKATSAPATFGAYSIAEFCRAHGDMSPAMYFKMRAMGLGPDEMEIGRRKAISVEAAARWREQREIAARESSKAKEENTAIA